MRNTLLRQLKYGWWQLSVFLALCVVGCGSGGNNTSTAVLGPFTAPPAPEVGATASSPFFVDTSNYFYNYLTPPFPVNDQMTNVDYPVTVAYQNVTTPPSGFVLSQQSEQSVTLWAQADPRVAIVSGVAASAARINVYLVNSIAYDDVPDIIGLTQLTGNSSNPTFAIYITTIDPVTGTPLANVDMSRVLTHEFGHAFGLGHSSDLQDVMYYLANSEQGATPASFLTYGDAMAIYTTLSNRHINWVPTQPTITPASSEILATKATALTTRTTVVHTAATVTDEQGTVVCVYHR